MIGLQNVASLNFHCHAPTCISMEVYSCPVGTPIADCSPANGKLLCKQYPVYGGSGNPYVNGSRFDETGYIAIPQCLWGPAEFGLEPPLALKDVTLHMVKKANATIGHYGEMAGGQPWVY